jgi:hypothetical protein
MLIEESVTRAKTGKKDGYGFFYLGSCDLSQPIFYTLLLGPGPATQASDRRPIDEGSRYSKA